MNEEDTQDIETYTIKDIDVGSLDLEVPIDTLSIATKVKNDLHKFFEVMPKEMWDMLNKMSTTLQEGMPDYAMIKRDLPILVERLKEMRNQRKAEISSIAKSTVEIIDKFSKEAIEIKKSYREQLKLVSDIEKKNNELLTKLHESHEGRVKDMQNVVKNFDTILEKSFELKLENERFKADTQTKTSDNLPPLPDYTKAQKELKKK